MYRVDKNEYPNGYVIKPDDTYHHEYCNRPVELYLEKYRPKTCISRSNCVFTFMNLKDALLFNYRIPNNEQNNEEYSIYEVEPLQYDDGLIMFIGDLDLTEILDEYIERQQIIIVEDAYDFENIEDDEFIKNICLFYWGKIGGKINFNGFSTKHSCKEYLTQGVKVISKVADYNDISKFRKIYYNQQNKNYLNFENEIYKDLLKKKFET